MKHSYNVNLFASKAKENNDQHQKIGMQDVQVSIQYPAKPGHEEATDFETAIAMTGYGRFNWLLMLVAVPTTWATLFDTSTMSFILPSAECDLGLDNFRKGVLNAITYAGMISSAFMWGFLSDTLGRRKILIVGYLIDGLVCLASSLSQSYAVMLGLRFVSGFMISGPYAIMMSYLAEFHGAQYRARVIMVTGIYVSIANFTIPGVAWGLIPQDWSWSLFNGYFKLTSWQVFVAVCSAPGILSGLVLILFDESPKFLMSCGKREEALQVFRRVYSLNTGNPPETYPVKVLVDETLKGTGVLTGKAHPGKNPFSLLKLGWKQITPLFRKPHLRNAVLVFTIQFGCLIGMNTIRLWLPQLFATMEQYETVQQATNPNSTEPVPFCSMLTSTRQLADLVPQNVTVLEDPLCTVTPLKETMYMNSVIVGGVNLIFYLLAGYFVNILGKKKIMILCFFLAAVCGVAVYWSMSVDVTLAIESIFLSMVGVASTTIIGIVVDLFPTSLRAMAVSLMMMFGRIGALLGNMLFPVLLDISCDMTFFLISGIVFACCLLSLTLPITKGKALE